MRRPKLEAVAVQRLWRAPDGSLGQFFLCARLSCSEEARKEKKKKKEKERDCHDEALASGLQKRPISSQSLLYFVCLSKNFHLRLAQAVSGGQCV